MARDHKGSILLTGLGCIDVRQVEAMAVSVGLRVVLQRNFQQVYGLSVMLSLWSVCCTLRRCLEMILVSF